MDAAGTVTTLHSFAGPEGYGSQRRPPARFRRKPLRKLRTTRCFAGVRRATFRGPSRFQRVRRPLASLLRSGSWRRADGSFYSTAATGTGCSSGAVVRIDPPATCHDRPPSFRVRTAQGRGGLCSRRATGTSTAPRNLAAHSAAASCSASTRPRPCRVVSVSPGSGPASGGTSLTLTGNHFQPGATVTLARSRRRVVVVSGDHDHGRPSPALTAGVAHDVVVQNPDGTRAARSRAWVTDPEDVAAGGSLLRRRSISFARGITVGCGNGLYCVTAVTRAQMAADSRKAMLGSGYVPPPPTGAVFADVPADAFAAACIEDLFVARHHGRLRRRQLLPGRIRDARLDGAVPAEGAIRGRLRRHRRPRGPCSTTSPRTPSRRTFIEDLAARGIAAGCSAQPPLYCPATAATRGQMAALLVGTFGLRWRLSAAAPFAKIRPYAGIVQR